MDPGDRCPPTSSPAHPNGKRCADLTRGAWWTSDDPDDLAQAAEACAGCPVLDRCREAGRSERWGVWGGVIRGQVRSVRLPVQHAALLALATAPRPLTVDDVAAELAGLLGTEVDRPRVADALTRCTMNGQATRYPTTPRTYTTTADGEAAAARWLDGDEGKGVRALKRGTSLTHPQESGSHSARNARD